MPRAIRTLSIPTTTVHLIRRRSHPTDAMRLRPPTLTGKARAAFCVLCISLCHGWKPKEKSAREIDCDPQSSAKEALADDGDRAYRYCSLKGRWVERTCSKDRVFNATAQDCRPAPGPSDDADAAIRGPFRQAVTPDLQRCQNGGQPFLVNDGVNAPYPRPCSATTGQNNGGCPSDGFYVCSIYTGYSYGLCCTNPTNGQQPTTGIGLPSFPIPPSDRRACLFLTAPFPPCVCGTTTPYLVDNAPVVCNPKFTSCPAEYQCTATTLGRYYCCSTAGAQSVCGAGSPYLVSSAPVICDPRSRSCPAGFDCLVLASTGTHYCCSMASTAAAGCPGGSVAFVDGGVARRCSPAASACPSGFSCQFNAAAAAYTCCSLPTDSENSCPLSQIAYLEADGLTARGCSPTPSSTCPTGFGCVMNAAQTRYQCCGQSFGCPYNSGGYIDPATGSYKTCSLSIPGQCLNGYQCVTSNALNLPICCSTSAGVVTSAPVGGTCPDGRSNSVLGCSVPNQFCPSPAPSGYLCQLTRSFTGVSQYGCCPNTGITGSVYTCPNGAQPLGVSGSPSPCPTQQLGAFCSVQGSLQYSCQAVTANTGATTLACCPGTNTNVGALCPSGQAPYYQSGTTTPMSCRNEAGRPSGCPAQFACLTSTAGTLACCLASQQPTLLCPSGQAPFFAAGTRNPLLCTDSLCPSGYECTSVDALRVCCFAAPRPPAPGPDFTFALCRPGPPLPVGLKCRDGATPAQGTGGAPVTCDPGLSDTCPANYGCGLVGGTFICCSDTPAAPLCEKGHVPALVSGTRKAVNCPAAASNAGCPPNFGCVKREAQLVCCADAYTPPGVQGQCPSGQSPFLTPGTNGPATCNPSASPDPCPDGFRCTQSGGLNICCSTTSAPSPNGQCSNGGRPVMLEATGAWVSCNAGGTAPCPLGSACLATAPGVFHCCSGTATSVPHQNSVCSGGGSPLRTPSGGLQPCSTTVPCPGGFVCLGTSCCPMDTQRAVCGLAVDSGSACVSGAANGQVRYWFNPSTAACTAFVYQGCGGNGNRFLTLAICKATCGGGNVNQGTCVNGNVGQCPNGLLSGGVPQTCAPNQANQCFGRAGYSCLISTTGCGICCQGIASCPFGQSAQVIPGSAYPRVCRVNDGLYSCASPYSCTASTLFGVSACCSINGGTNVNGGCPTAFTATGEACILGQANQCLSSISTGASCYQSNGGTNQGLCCRSGGSTGACPSGYVADVTRGVCQPGVANSCGFNTGSNCYQTGTFGQGICCRPIGSTFNTCPVGYTSNNVQCNINSNTCGFNAVCYRSNTASTLGTCCLTSANAGTACPAGYVANNVQCNANANLPCGTGGVCYRANTASSFGTCCVSNTAATGTCPNGYLSNNVQCNVAQNSCGLGGICYSSLGGSFGVCCTSQGGQSGCPSGYTSTNVVCNIGTALACGSNGFCYRANVATQLGTCCSNNNAGTAGTCPSGYFSNNIACQTNIINSCGVGSGYVCLSSTGSVTGQCCRSSNNPTGVGSCPSGIAGSGTCQINGINSCPNGYLCYRSSAQTALGTCCQLGGVLCPSGQALYSVPGAAANQPQLCGLNYGSCPFANNYQTQCSISTNRQVSICCYPAGVVPGAVTPTNTYLCPSGGRPIQDNCPANSGTNYCQKYGAGYQCLPVQGRYYCCPSTGTTSRTCPAGQITQIPQVACAVGGINQCAANYYCYRAVSTDTVGLCCGVGGTGNVGLTFVNCLNRATPQLQPGSTQRVTCSSPGSTFGCAANYICSQSTLTGTNICCGNFFNTDDPGCPVGLFPLYTNAGEALECHLGVRGNCATGFTCTRATGDSGRSFCCGPRPVPDKPTALATTAAPTAAPTTARTTRRPLEQDPNATAGTGTTSSICGAGRAVAKGDNGRPITCTTKTGCKAAADTCGIVAKGIGYCCASATGR